jgi:hypothetical protein
MFHGKLIFNNLFLVKELMKTKTGDDQKLWDSYHELLLGPDITRIRKLLTRYELYRLSKDVKGDILECGVFKGSGLMFWLKILAVYEPDSEKKVIGFDTFSFFQGSLMEKEKIAAEQYLQETEAKSIPVEQIYSCAQNAGLKHRVDLIEGDIAKTAPDYVQTNPQLKISLLHLDLDTYDGTKAALEAFYPFVTQGGVIVLDEYGDHQWGETEAVDEYFKDEKIKIESISDSAKPRAFIIKP